MAALNPTSTNNEEISTTKNKKNENLLLQKNLEKSEDAAYPFYSSSSLKTKDLKFPKLANNCNNQCGTKLKSMQPLALTSLSTPSLSGFTNTISPPASNPSSAEVTYAAASYNTFFPTIDMSSRTDADDEDSDVIVPETPSPIMNKKRLSRHPLKRFKSSSSPKKQRLDGLSATAKNDICPSGKLVEKCRSFNSNNNNNKRSSFAELGRTNSEEAHAQEIEEALVTIRRQLESASKRCDNLGRRKDAPEANETSSEVPAAPQDSEENKTITIVDSPSYNNIDEGIRGGGGDEIGAHTCVSPWHRPLKNPAVAIVSPVQKLGQNNEDKNEQPRNNLDNLTVASAASHDLLPSTSYPLPEPSENVSSSCPLRLSRKSLFGELEGNISGSRDKIGGDIVSVRMKTTKNNGNKTNNQNFDSGGNLNNAEERDSVPKWLLNPSQRLIQAVNPRFPSSSKLSCKTENFPDDDEDDDDDDVDDDDDDNNDNNSRCFGIEPIFDVGAPRRTFHNNGIKSNSNNSNTDVYKSEIAVKAATAAVPLPPSKIHHLPASVISSSSAKHNNNNTNSSSTSSKCCCDSSASFSNRCNKCRNLIFHRPRVAFQFSSSSSSDSDIEPLDDFSHPLKNCKGGGVGVGFSSSYSLPYKSSFNNKLGEKDFSTTAQPNCRLLSEKLGSKNRNLTTYGNYRQQQQDAEPSSLMAGPSTSGMKFPAKSNSSSSRNAGSALTTNAKKSNDQNSNLCLSIAGRNLDPEIFEVGSDTDDGDDDDDDDDGGNDKMKRWLQIKDTSQPLQRPTSLPVLRLDLNVVSHPLTNKHLSSSKHGQQHYHHHHPPCSNSADKPNGQKNGSSSSSRDHHHHHHHHHSSRSACHRLANRNHDNRDPGGYHINIEDDDDDDDINSFGDDENDAQDDRSSPPPSRPLTPYPASHQHIPHELRHGSSSSRLPYTPDPVEVVRQIEGDSLYAQMLQAQFDAEFVDAVPLSPFLSPLDATEPHPSSTRYSRHHRQVTPPRSSMYRQRPHRATPQQSLLSGVRHRASVSRSRGSRDTPWSSWPFLELSEQAGILQEIEDRLHQINRITGQFLASGPSDLERCPNPNSNPNRRRPPVNHPAVSSSDSDIDHIALPRGFFNFWSDDEEERNHHHASNGERLGHQLISPRRVGRGFRGRRRRGLPVFFSNFGSPGRSDGNDYEVLLELAEHLGDVVKRGLSKNEINRLPTRLYATGNGLSSSNSEAGLNHTQCHICMSDYENGEKLRILPCFHDFHAACIDRWLQENNTCPICRVQIKMDQD